MTKTLIILAAGASSRMKQSWEKRADLKDIPFKSKALIRLGKSKKTALDYLLDNAQSAGFEQIVLVVGKDSSAFREHFGTKDKDNRYRTFSLSYAVQSVPEGHTKPLGTADAIQQTLDQYSHLKEESFVVCNGDNLYSADALRILKDARHPNAYICYDRDGLLFSMEKIRSFALLVEDEEGYLKEIIEKPDEDQLINHLNENDRLLVSMNIWKFLGKDIYPYLEMAPVHPVRNEKEIPTAALLYTNANPLGLKGYYKKEHVPDLTSADDIALVEKHLQLKK